MIIISIIKIFHFRQIEGTGSEITHIAENKHSRNEFSVSTKTGFYYANKAVGVVKDFSSLLKTFGVVDISGFVPVSKTSFIFSDKSLRCLIALNTQTQSASRYAGKCGSVAPHQSGDASKVIFSSPGQSVLNVKKRLIYVIDSDYICRLNLDSKKMTDILPQPFFEKFLALTADSKLEHLYASTASVILKVSTTTGSIRTLSLFKKGNTKNQSPQSFFSHSISMTFISQDYIIRSDSIGSELMIGDLKKGLAGTTCLSNPPLIPCHIPLYPSAVLFRAFQKEVIVGGQNGIIVVIPVSGMLFVVCLFFVVSAVHFAPYLTGLSSMMLI